MTDKNEYEKSVEIVKQKLSTLSHENVLQLAADAIQRLKNIELVANLTNQPSTQRIQIIKKMVNGKQNETN